MSEPLKSDQTVREYLLGRVSDETTLEGLEELLFTDEEFCARVALAEDGLVNDYVMGRLGEADADSFRATLAGNPDRLFNVELTRALKEQAAARDARAAEVAGSEAAEAKTAAGAKAAEAKTAEAGPGFFDSLKAFFGRPRYVTALSLVLAAAVAALIYFGRGGGGADELAELRAVHGRERPTETRISGFDYAPLAQLRGEPEEREKRRSRRMELDFIEGVEKTPGARTHHALGVFRLTRGEYADAVREFESALKFDPGSARLHNDLGAAHFGLAKVSARERRFEELSRALEEFTAATELDAGLLEALFNRSLALQELGMPREAKESWTLYLQKDPSSKWADEARAHLARLDDASAPFKSDERVLADFLDAYRSRDYARAEWIHDETKGLLTTAAVPLQLSRRYLLARLRGDADEARESLDALEYVGRSERARHSEFFFPNSPATTRASARTNSGRCCAPKTPSPKRIA
jgi:tetratricopeptide (TPR) repeat protein